MNASALRELIPTDVLRTKLDGVFERALEQQRIVGGVVVVMQDGQELYASAAGLADREARLPMREDTVFRLASITKPIVTVAALRLVERGQLELDAPITRYLPSFKPALADGSAPGISVRQLLTHTSGLSYGFSQALDGPYRKAGVSDGIDAPGLSFDEELRRIVSAGLSRAPGSAWEYSLSLDVLGAVLERVCAKPLPEVIEALVTQPLGMTHTTFVAKPNQPLATPYVDGAPPERMREGHRIPFVGESGLWFSPARAFEPTSFPSGGAGMIGTAREVTRLLELVRSGGGPLLERATTQSMHTNQTGNLPILMGPGWGFGYGGAVLLDPRAASSPQSPGTWCWGGVYGHSWFVDPALRLVVVGLTNTAIEGMLGRFPTELRDAVYAAAAERSR